MTGYGVDTTHTQSMPWLQPQGLMYNPTNNIGGYPNSAIGSLQNYYPTNYVERPSEKNEGFNYEELGKKTVDVLKKEQANNEAKKELKANTELLKSGEVQEDGSLKIKKPMEEYKKLPWWKKGLRAISNMAQGVWKIATNFVGYENGKWSFKKLLGNVAKAALVIGACCIPVVGPVISAGLLATGVVTGGIAVVRGAKKASEAKTLDELDNAWQDIGSGAFIGVTSAFGLRGLGKGFRLSNPNGGMAIVKAPSVAKTRTSMPGKCWQGISQFGRDITVNMFRATKNAANTNRLTFQLIKQHETGWCNGWFKSFGKVWMSNARNVLPAVGKKKFNRTRQETVDSINGRLAEVEAQINTPGISKPLKTHLKAEKQFLKAQLRQLEKTTHSNHYADLKTNSKAHQRVQKLNEDLALLESNSTASPEVIANLRSQIKYSETLAKNLSQLAELRTQTLKAMALRPKKNAAELNAYVGRSSNTRLGYLYDISKANLTWGSALKAPFKLVWNTICLPFKPWEYCKATPAGSFYKVEQAILPEYEVNYFVDLFAMANVDIGASQTLLAEEYQAITKEYETTRELLAANDKEIQRQKAELA